MPVAPLLPIGAAQAASIAQALSMHVATCDAALRPHLVRGFGCRVSPDRREVTVFFSSRLGAKVLDDLRRNGRIAVAFSRPATNVTFQLKAGDAMQVPLAPGDDAFIEAYVEAFLDEVGAIGFPHDVVRNVFRHDAAERVAVRFHPTAAFDQTPGPRAGEALAAEPS